MLFLFAVLVRAAFVLSSSDLVKGDWMDSVRYERVAHNISQGRGFSEFYGKPTAFAPPLYPYFLAGINRVFGSNPMVVRLFQALFGGLVCLAVYRMARGLFGERAGLLAMAACAVYPDLVVMTGYLYTETLFMAFTCWSFVRLLSALSPSGTRRDAFWAGALFGLGILTRHVLLFFPVFLLVLLAVFRRARPHFRKALVFASVAYALVVPWLIRNAVVFHAFIPITTGGGGEFYAGSYLPFGGKYHYTETQRQISELTREAKTEVEKDHILYTEGLNNIARHPFQYLGVVANKGFRFVFQVYENVPSGRPRTRNPWVWSGLALAYYPLLLLAGAAVWTERAKWISLLPLYGVLVYSILLCFGVHVVPRYRIPLIPFVIVLASAAMDSLLTRITSGRT